MPSDAAPRFEFCQVTTTCRLRADAEALGRSVVEARLAPSAQVEGPISRTSWSDNKVQVTWEWRIVFQIPTDRYEALAQHVRDNHVHEAPDIVSLPVLTGASESPAHTRDSVS
jgi:periplasmic divalent cation tolerance protein